MSNLSLVGIHFILYSRLFILGASDSFEFCRGLFFVLLVFLILGCFFVCCVLSSYLVCLFLPVGFGAFILWLALLGGRSGKANREGSIYFSGFFQNWSDWAKTVLAPHGEGFLRTVLASKSGMEGAKK